jgi:hypothetical protein
MSEGYFKFGAAMKETTNKGYKNEIVPERSEYFNLKANEGKAVIRVLPKEMYTFTQHACYNKKGNFIRFTCTKNNPKTDGNCIGCYYGKYGDAVKTGLLEEKKAVGYSKQFVFTILDLRQMHELLAAGGNKTFEKCSKSKNCELCKNKIPLVTVGRRHWAVGKNQKTLLAKANMDIGGTCLTCKTGTIKTIALKCSECGSDLIDPEADISPEKFTEMAFEDIQCSSCGHVGMPVESIECSNGCEHPVRAGIYDTNLVVEKTAPKDNPKSVTLIITPTMKFEPIPENLIEVPDYDFSKIFETIDIDKQCAFTSLANPWKISDKIAVNSAEADEFVKTE